MLKRVIDITFSLAAILILFPFFIIISIMILATSRGGVFYMQKRVGKGNKDFYMYKFRTMFIDSDKKGLLTIGGRDPRITPFGYFLRKYKLDELPQLFNVLNGTMSLVGPRPEVRKYVDLYNSEQARVLLVRPGLTDYASVKYFNESDLLATSPDPEQTYISEIMPAKLALNQKYISEAGLVTDMKIIWSTVKRIFT
jgi:lipopolysaccharide/colanic/teichoic acid biosynthesis glycosyltransferase